MAAAGLFQLPRLNDSNYVSWEVKMRMYLLREDLWDIVENPPVPMDDAQDLRANQRALSSIVLCLEDNQLPLVRGIQSAQECWQLLRAAHVRDSVLSQITLSRQLYRARLETGGSMAKHLDYMRSTFDQLQEMGLEFPEHQKVFIVLSSLDSSYDILAVTLEAVPRAQLTMAYLTGRLLEEEQKRADNQVARSQHSPAEKAVSAARRPDRDVPGVLAVQRCFSCGATTHLQRSCPVRRQQPTAGTQGRRRRRGRQPPQVSVVNAAAGESKHQVWILDSGASNHVTKCRDLLVSMDKPSIPFVSLANGLFSPVEGEGAVSIPGFGELHSVLLVSQLKHNLLSVPCLDREGYKVMFANGCCTISKNGNVCGQAVLQEGLYKLTLSGATQPAVYVSSHNKPIHDGCIHMLHRKLGHMNYQLIKQTVEHSDGLKVKPCSNYLHCNVCAQTKTKAAPVSKESDRITTRPFELVACDLIGPMPKSLGGAKFALTIIDHFTRFGFVYPLHSKDQVTKTLQNWVKLVERRYYPNKVTQIQSDKGGEFTGHALSQWLRERGISQRFTNVATPAENGLIERRNGVLQSIMKALLADSGLPFSFWAEAIKVANYLSNRVFHPVIGQTPYQALYGRRPNLSHIKVFGCNTWINVPQKLRRKGQKQSEKAVLVGYEPGQKSYRLYGPNNKLSLSRSVTCDEQRWQNVIQNDSLVSLPTCEPTVLPRQQLTAASDNVSQEEGKQPEESLGREAVKEEASLTPVVPRRSQRSTKGIPPQRFSPSHATICNVTVPSTYDDVFKLPVAEQKKWQEAMSAELNALKEKQVYQEAQLPEGKKAIGCRWVYKLKQSDTQTIYKARIVGKGFSQARYADYDQVFSPTVKSQSIRILLTLATLQGWCIRQADISTAYLNAPLEEDIYMERPQGASPTSGKSVWKLQRALYGLKQSARQWYLCLTNALKDLEFLPSSADPCVFIKLRNNVPVMTLAIFVDDLLICGQDKKEVNAMLHTLNKRFSLKDLGPIHEYLGVCIEKGPQGELLWHQRPKIIELLDKYGMADCKGAKTPMELNFQKVADDESPEFDVHMFETAIGSLQYLSVWSRPDISYATNQLSRHVCSPKVVHWQAFKRILRYLKATQDYCLSISPKGQPVLAAYADASWGDDPTTYKSTSGYTVVLAGVVVEWRVTKQTNVSLSSSEAEFASVSQLVTDLEYTSQLLKDLGVCNNHPIVVYEDNQTCIAMAETETGRARTKYIGIRYANVRHAVQRGFIKLKFCPSQEMMADVLTKPLGPIKHQDMVQMLGMKTM